MKKHTFKVGEKIKCINNERSKILIINDIYTVRECYFTGVHEYVKVEEIPMEHAYYTRKFESIGELPYEIF